MNQYAKNFGSRAGYGLTMQQPLTKNYSHRCRCCRGRLLGELAYDRIEEEDSPEGRWEVRRSTTNPPSSVLIEKRFGEHCAIVHNDNGRGVEVTLFPKSKIHNLTFLPEFEYAIHYNQYQLYGPKNLNVSIVKLCHLVAEYRKDVNLLLKTNFTFYLDGKSRLQNYMKAMHHATPALMRHLNNGTKGKDLMEKIKIYINIQMEMEVKLREHERARYKFKEAAAGLKRVTERGKIINAEEKVKLAKEALEKIQQRKNDATRFIDTAFNWVTNLSSFNPVKLGISVTKAIGSEVKGRIMGELFSKELSEAKKNLENAKKDLLEFVNLEQEYALEEAKNKLKAESEGLLSATMALDKETRMSIDAEDELIGQFMRTGLSAFEEALNMRLNLKEPPDKNTRDAFMIYKHHLERFDADFLGELQIGYSDENVEAHRRTFARFGDDRNLKIVRILRPYSLENEKVVTLMRKEVQLALMELRAIAADWNDYFGGSYKAIDDYLREILRAHAYRK